MTAAETPIVGLDIGGTACAVSVGVGDRIEEVHCCATRGPDETVDELIAAILRLPPQSRRVVGIAAGTLGAAKGLISGAPNLPGWDDVPIVERVQRATGARAFLLNDAKAGALAEWIYGAGRGCRHMVFLTAGTGMGAGLILDGRLYVGRGNAGEVGHVRLAPDGPWGYNKTGSFEGFCSGGGIGRLARQVASERGIPSSWDCATGDEITARTVATAATAGEPLAREILRTAGLRLGEALAILIDVLNVERIILGSVYLRCRPFLEPAMREALAREALPESLAGCEILPAGLGEEIGNYAAIAAARYHLEREAAADR